MNAVIELYLTNMLKSGTQIAGRVQRILSEVTWISWESLTAFSPEWIRWMYQVQAAGYEDSWLHILIIDSQP